MADFLNALRKPSILILVLARHEMLFKHDLKRSKYVAEKKNVYSLRGLYWLVTDQHNGMTLPKFVPFHYPPSPHTIQYSLYGSKFRIFQQLTRTSATVLKLYILYVVQYHVQYNTREISHFYIPYYNTQLYSVLVMGDTTNFEMFLAKFLHSMFLFHVF